MSKNSIKPSVILTIDMNNILNIPIIVRTATGNILSMSNITKLQKHHLVRQRLIEQINNCKEQYNIDTILLDQNKLFIDKIDRYPDPYVLRNVLLGYGIQISIEDNFYDSIKYILALPDYEWKSKILNTNAKYSIDLYKSHILEQSIYSDYIDIIDSNNYYRALCLSESTLFDVLMIRKYQINKGD